MFTDPSLLVRIWEYLSASGVYWWGALGVLLALERIAERVFHDWWRRRADPWVTPSRRKQILFIFAALAFLYGNFRAFDDERHVARKFESDAIRLEAERNANGTLAQDRKNEIDRLSNQITQLQMQAPKPSVAGSNRNPDGLYQLGEQVATVTGAKVDRGHSTIFFDSVRSQGNLDDAKELEYREFTIKCEHLAGAPPRNTTVGMFIGMTAGASCEIVRLREK